MILFILQANIFFAQESPLKTTIGAFEDYAANHPVEKVYLHLDKPYYAAGEYMYFRAYLTDMNLNQENVESHIVYVELSDAKKNLIKRLLLYSEENEFSGQMQLPNSLPSANYHLRAYTNRMRNAGEDYFYHRDIYIGNITDRKQEHATPKNFDYSVGFFPEGGQLLAGFTDKVAFKALGNDGFGTEVSGILSDEEGKELLQFTGVHSGMGSFSFTPEEGKTYKVSVQSNGITKEYTLPAATEGLALSARQDEELIYLTIHSTSDEPESIYLIGQSRNTVCYDLGRLMKNHEQQIVIDKRRFPTGIAQFTLFKDGHPVSERLLFIDREDDLHVDIIPDKEQYGDREKAAVEIRVTDDSGQPVEGSFSLSVTDNKTVAPSIGTQNIKGSLLLDSDLKGYVESPGWYFAGDEPERSEALDNLLCTQGWSRFVWDQLTEPETSDTYPVESDFMLTGRVTDMKGNPVQNAGVTFLSNENMPGTAVTDADGRFGFIGFNCPEGASFTLKCDNTKTSLAIDSPNNKYVQTGLIPLTKAENEQNQALMEAYTEQTGRRIKDGTIQLPEVKITEKGKQKAQEERSMGGSRSYHYGEEKLNKKITIGRVIQMLPKTEKGPRSLFSKPSPPWYIVDDGMKLDFVSFLSTYGSMNAYRFESIDVLCAEDAVTIYGLEASGGVYLLKTKKTIDANDLQDASVQKPQSASVQTIYPEGYCVRKEFYVPEYDKPEVRENSTPDLRTTIYWNPVIHTGKNGKAAIGFYTADHTTSYSYVLEGIGNDKMAFTKK